MESEEIQRPGIVKVLRIVVWITIFAGGFFCISGIFDGGKGDIEALGLGLALSGALLFALCVAIEKLNQIEHHLRPGGKP